MDPISLLVLVAAFLLVTVVCWAILILFCCIASSCSLPPKVDVQCISSLYEEPMSLVPGGGGGKAACYVESVAFADGRRAVPLVCPSPAPFPCQAYFGMTACRGRALAVAVPGPPPPAPPPLPRRNQGGCRVALPVSIADVVYV